MLGSHKERIMGCAEIIHLGHCAYCGLTSEVVWVTRPLVNWSECMCIWTSYSVWMHVQMLYLQVDLHAYLYSTYLKIRVQQY